jgi:hypothetical protein
MSCCCELLWAADIWFRVVRRPEVAALSSCAISSACQRCLGRKTPISHLRFVRGDNVSSTASRPAKASSL